MTGSGPERCPSERAWYHDRKIAVIKISAKNLFSLAIAFIVL